MRPWRRKQIRHSPIQYSTSTSTATTTKYSVFSPDTNQEELPPCPWSTSPRTIEHFLVVSDQRRLWIAENGRQPYSSWSIILTHELVEDLCREVIGRENK